MTAAEEYRQLVQNCAEQGRSLMRMLTNEGRAQPLYLYYRQSQSGKPGALFLVCDDAPNPYGYQLVTGEGLRSNVPYEDYFTWVYERAKRVPILSI